MSKLNKLTIFYKRIETEDTITIIYNSFTTKLPVILMLLGLLFLKLAEVSSIFTYLASISVMSTVMLGIIYIIQVPRVRKETDIAMAEERVQSIVGSDYSYKNPLTIIIRKS